MFAPPPSDYITSLRWADRQYSHAVPYAQAPGLDTLEAALIAYRQVEKRWGSRLETRLRIAKSLALLGKFNEGITTLAKDQSERAATESRRLRELRWVQTNAAPFLGEGREARQILPVPSRPNAWVVLGGIEGRPIGTDERELATFDKGKLGLFQRTPDGKLTPLGPIKQIQHDHNDEAWSARLTLVDLTGRGDYAAIVLFNFFAADTMPTRQTIYRIEPDRLRWVWNFRGKGSVRQVRGHGGRLAIAIESTWKVWWQDVYEWRNGHFVFANARYPELYHMRAETLDRWELMDYPALLRRASLLCIAKRYREAERSLRLAGSVCLKIRPVRDNGEVPDWNHYDAGFYGGTKENLEEIRLRRRLLRNHDFNQRILVRPYDFDLQIPPWVLGPAGGGR